MEIYKYTGVLIFETNVLLIVIPTITASSNVTTKRFRIISTIIIVINLLQHSETVCQVTQHLL